MTLDEFTYLNERLSALLTERETLLATSEPAKAALVEPPVVDLAIQRYAGDLAQSLSKGKLPDIKKSVADCV